MGNLADQFNGTPAGANRSGLAADFDNTAPAERLAPIPTGEYLARAVEAGLDESRKGTPFYGMKFEVASGAHAGRRLVMKWYLSQKALPLSRADLAALDITSYAMLQQGCVPRGLVRLRVALRKGEDGGEYNEVRAVFPYGEGLQGWTAPGGDTHSEASTATPAPVAPAPVAAAPNPEPVAPATAGDLPVGLVDPALL